MDRVTNTPKPQDVNAFLELSLESGESIGGMLKSIRDEWPLGVVDAILIVCGGLHDLAKRGNAQAAQVLADYEAKYPGAVRRFTDSNTNEN